MRWALAGALLASFLTACSFGGGESARPGATVRIESCVLRLSRAENRQVLTSEVGRYARKTYCEPFEERGWIYDDGALRIAAYTWLTEGGTCATRTADGEEVTHPGPCDEADEPGPRMLDCALLHHVRRIEVHRYIKRLQREETVRCDDGTPVNELGVPFGAPAPPGA
jgi:hypothetical protein